MVKEQRKHPRHLAEVVVRYSNATPGLLTPEKGEGVIENVSLGGIFLNTDDPLPIGTPVDVRFSVSEGDGHGRVVARGVVRWNRSRFQPRGMGLEFAEISHGREALEEWLRELEKRKSRL